MGWGVRGDVGVRTEGCERGEGGVGGEGVWGVRG